MSRSLKLYIALLVIAGAVALAITSFVFGAAPAVGVEFDGIPGRSPLEIGLGIAFWTIVALSASALPVRLPRGMLVAVGIAPILAATNLGGPAVGGWVAAIGTTEMRELRGRVPWYGTLANHAGIALPAILAGLVIETIRGSSPSTVLDFAATLAGAGGYFALNLILVSVIIALRTGQSLRDLMLGDFRAFWANLLALAPLGWLMARMYGTDGGGWWATLLFALPLYTTRVAYNRFVEMREMFTQTIGALAEAVDKRDPFP